LLRGARFISIAVGLRYLRSKEFQSYHAVALGRDWNSLDPALQALLLAFIRGLGATLIAIAISTVALLIFPFREGATWATYALPLPLIVTAVTATVGHNNYCARHRCAHACEPGLDRHRSHGNWFCIFLILITWSKDGSAAGQLVDPRKKQILPARRHGGAFVAHLRTAAVSP
jgi:hypothetical protein